VLDVGCGTGRLAAAFAERGAKVWGVDPSEEMLARARERTGCGVGFKRAEAESLPFKDGWFERAVLYLVVHLVDRGRALPEIARVLAPSGRVVIATFRPESFDRIWLARFFPSLPAIDRARFPEPLLLTQELRAAGFAGVRQRDVSHKARVRRDDALERLRGRFISTLWLLPDEEYRAGVARAERELEEETEYSREWAILVAST
jgi:SAM-dependent methyltransferase